MSVFKWYCLLWLLVFVFSVVIDNHGLSGISILAINIWAAADELYTRLRK